MSPAQRSIHLEKLFKSEQGNELDPGDLEGLNITFEPHIPGIAESNWRKIQIESEKHTKGKKVMQFPGMDNNFVVHEIRGEKPISWNVSRSAAGVYNCDCKGFKESYICGHSLATARFGFVFIFNL